MIMVVVVVVVVVVVCAVHGPEPNTLMYGCGKGNLTSTHTPIGDGSF